MGTGIKAVVANRALGEVLTRDLLIGYGDSDDLSTGMFMKIWCVVNNTDNLGNPVVYEVFDSFIFSNLEEAEDFRSEMVKYGASIMHNMVGV